MTQREEALLLAYADGELGSEDISAVERLLAADPAARAQLQVYRDTASLLRGGCAEAFYQDAPTHSAAPLPEANRGTVRRTLLALAASILIGIMGFGVGLKIGELPPSHFEALLGDIAEYHNVYARDPAHLVELPASQQAEIERWLGRSIGVKITIPDLSRAGYQFIGGRLLVGDGKPVAQLLYSRPGALPLGICVTAPRDAPEQVKVEHRGGLTLAGWREGAYTYVIVGDLADGPMLDLAQHISISVRG